MAHAALRWIGIALAGCNGGTSLPPPPCAVPGRAVVDPGPPAPRSPTASVEVELRAGYVEAQVRGRLDTLLPASATATELAVPKGQPGWIPNSGVLVKHVSLTEVVAADGTHRNELVIQVAPWTLHQAADPQDASRQLLSKTEIQRYFTLHLSLAPRIAGSSVVVPLELAQIHDDSTNETVVCTDSPAARNPSYDVLAAEVHQGVLDALIGTADQPGAPPLELPIGTVTDLVAGIVGPPLSLQGVALGTDQDLKIGLLFDKGSPGPFDSATSLSHFPSADWGVAIDPAFVTTAITAKLAAAVGSQAVPIALGPVNVAYQTRPLPGGGRENLITVGATATATTSQLHCSVPLTIAAEIAPQVCTLAGRSTLLGCSSDPAIAPTATACVVFETFLFGDATATVCSPGPCPPPPSMCSSLADVQFDVAPGDTFYATELETDGQVFYLAGRSSTLDPSRGGPAPPPACPP